MHATVKPLASRPARPALVGCLLAALLAAPGIPLGGATDPPPAHDDPVPSRAVAAPSGGVAWHPAEAHDDAGASPGPDARPGMPAAATAPPFAPGWDDVKTWDDPPPPATSSATATADGPALAAPPVPWPVLATSWHNRQLAAGVAPPADAAPAPVQTAGDFFQQGSLAWFTIAAAAEGTPIARFVAQDRSGRWIDRSDELLADPAQRRLCDAPRQALTADFDGDGRPDVWLVCAGAPHLLLASGGGRRGYRRIEVAAGWSTTTEAADLDGDGHVDVFAADAPQAALRGRGDGSFEPLRR